MGGAVNGWTQRSAWHRRGYAFMIGAPSAQSKGIAEYLLSA
jgi:hypothetical protein